MDKFKALTPIVIYGFILGLAYSFSFWGRFSINPMEFASVVDVAKIAAWPIGASVVFLCVNLFMSPHLGDDWTKFEHIAFPFKLSPEWLSRLIQIIWEGAFIWLVYWLIYSVSNPSRWMGIGACLVVLAEGRLHRQKVIYNLFPSYAVRTFVLMFGIGAPFFALSAGGINAETIKSGGAKFLLDEQLSTLPTSIKDGVEKEFVGDLGGFHVFYSLDDKLFFVKSADGQVIALRKNPSAKGSFLL